MALHIVHQALSGWEGTIHRDAPSRIHNLCQDLAERLYAHLFVTPTRYPPGTITAATVASVARWAGLLREAEWTEDGDLKISGPGLAALMGDEDNKGDGPTAVFSQTKAFYNGPSNQSWIRDHVLGLGSAGTGDPALNGLTLGNVGTHATAYSIEVQLAWSRRQILDAACELAGREWRINPPGTVDIDTPENLCADGEVIIGAVTSDRERDLVGIPARVGVTHVGHDRTSEVQVNDALSAAQGSATDATWSFVGWDGDPLTLRRVIQAQEANSDTAAASLAAAQLGRFDQIDTELSIATDHPDLLAHVLAGDRIGVWAPTKGLIDPTNPIHYRGEIIAPARIRVLGLDVNVPDGFDWFLRWWDPDLEAFQLTDLTPYMIPEEPGATLEVGRLQQTLLRG